MKVLLSIFILITIYTVIFKYNFLKQYNYDWIQKEIKQFPFEEKRAQ